VGDAADEFVLSTQTTRGEAIQFPGRERLYRKPLEDEPKVIREHLGLLRGERVLPGQ
jgi:hypothetical protein